MNSLSSELTQIFSDAFAQCGHERKYGQVVESQRPELGQFQCNGALGAAKSAKKNPKELAERIIGQVSGIEYISNLTIAGPGFINITLSDTFLASRSNSMLDNLRTGAVTENKSETVIIDFCSPNIAKPMHVGHLRSAIIGDSLQRLLRYLGYHVISDNHVGDWGTQMGMLIGEMRERKPELLYFNPEYKGPYPSEPPLTIEELERMYPVASKKCKENETLMNAAIAATDELQQGRKGYIALWKHFVALSLETLKKDFDALDITFDHWYGESFYADRMAAVVEKLQTGGHAVVSDGALVLPVAQQDDTKEIPPVMLVKSGGGYLYATSDLATLDFRMKTFHAKKILYVVDQRQSLHFEQVFRAVRKTGIVSPDVVLEHIGFGTVNGVDGKPFKTREGGVMKLSDLIEQTTQKAQQRMKEAGIAQNVGTEEFNEIARMVGIAALKFADLMNHRASNYVFDIDKFTTFEGKTGPYLLYSAVRVKSILRKTREQNITEGAILPPTDCERKLMLLLCQLPDMLNNAVQSYAPNFICDFAYNLAQEFNRFYQQCHILREENKPLQSSWLSLALLCLKELELLLGLLGIKVPERM